MFSTLKTSAAVLALIGAFGSVAMAGPSIPLPGPFPRPLPQHAACPDPAIASIRVRDVRFREGQVPVMTIEVKVENRGRADYVSRRGQQSVMVDNGNPRRLLARQGFASLRAGRWFSFRFRYEYFGGEFVAPIRARLSYDPDIRIDGNPRNDDCNLANNSLTLTPAEQRAAIARFSRGSGSRVPRNVNRPVPLPRVPLPGFPR